uniref:Uncharacterized protein n=1 Tax=Physcomitrium patens TaxID=3218 RepID=A0A2K1KW25_PHYPA|nr:hypothetical protein PHYPA_004990 [Physcomitrium patens]
MIISFIFAACTRFTYWQELVFHFSFWNALLSFRINWCVFMINCIGISGCSIFVH